MKAKLFHNTQTFIEADINKWLAENPNIEIVSTQLNTTPREDSFRCTCLILYKEAEEKADISGQFNAGGGAKSQ
jgi:hypothetical protein